jgi:hypothetical protein
MNFGKLSSLASALAVVALCAGCSTPGGSNKTGSTTAAAPASSTAAGRVVKSRDGRFEGEIVGTPAPGSKFAKLQIGMDPSEVQDIFGRGPDRSHSYESGKRWIPFYFGNDARRRQMLYKGEGCLVFTDGNIWGGAGGDLIQIVVDPSGACYEQ